MRLVGWGVTLSRGSGGGGGGVHFLQRPGPLGGSVAVSETVADWVGWLVCWQAGWLVDRLGALGSGRTESREGSGGSRCRRTLSFSVWCCQAAGVVLFLFSFHIMLFCSEFTSEEFSSPRTLWFSCLGVRELWMLRESSSLGGAFTGSSSLFWELGSSYPGRGGGGWVGEESTVRTTTTVSLTLPIAEKLYFF